ncbi:MAG: heme exporter protein B [Chloroflexi bacterium]|nr:MAG: heme exporter protein B [Chloroflexota bacterium]MBA4376098.1 cytochrome C biogenesis protein [Anaerolinea sp.]
MDYIRVILTIFWKDILAERRTREILSAMLVFALVVILLFVFAFDLSPETRRNTAAGVIWVTLCFSGTIGLNRTLSVEKDRGGIDGLMLAPADRTALFFGKALTNWVYMLLTALFVVPIYSLFNNTNLFSFTLLGVIMLGTFGYIVTGTLLSSLSLQLRSREMLLPVLLFPVVIPLLLSAIRATSILLEGGSQTELNTWLVLLFSYDLIFLAISVMVFDKIIED